MPHFGHRHRSHRNNRDDAVSSDAQAARHLAMQTDTVRVSGQGSWRAVLRWISGGRLDRPRGASASFGWWATASTELPGWRERAAHLTTSQPVFAVDYQLCRRCGLAWVEQPCAEPRYQRCGPASAAFAALRTEHPRPELAHPGSHLTESRAFWPTVGADVVGGYRQRHLCPHVRPG